MGGDDLVIIWAKDVEEKAKSDPKLMDVLRNFNAVMRQADAGVKSGQYKDMDEALKVLGNMTFEPLSDEDAIRLMKGENG